MVFFENINKLSESLSEDILAIAESSIMSKSSFKVVLAGGCSLLKTYKILCNSESNWSKWHVYLSDERCLPLGNKGRNDYMINLVWLNNSPIPKSNINFIPVELGANNAVLNYEKIINSAGCFDLVILGTGEDGHTASLFPGHSYKKNKSVVFEKNSPKYPKERISMSYSSLGKSKNIFKVINGAEKKYIIDLWHKENDFPVKKVTGKFEKVFVCV